VISHEYDFASARSRFPRLPMRIVSFERASDATRCVEHGAANREGRSVVVGIKRPRNLAARHSYSLSLSVFLSPSFFQSLSLSKFTRFETIRLTNDRASSTSPAYITRYQRRIGVSPAS